MMMKAIRDIERRYNEVDAELKKVFAVIVKSAEELQISGYKIDELSETSFRIGYFGQYFLCSLENFLDEGAVTYGTEDRDGNIDEVLKKVKVDSSGNTYSDDIQTTISDHYREMHFSILNQILEQLVAGKKLNQDAR